VFGLSKLTTTCPFKEWQKLFFCDKVAEKINLDFSVITKEHSYLGYLYLALGRYLEAFNIFSHENVLDRKALELIQVHRSIDEDTYLKRANELIQIDKQFFAKVLAGRMHGVMQGVSPKMVGKYVEDQFFLLEYFKTLGDSYYLDEENILFKITLYCQYAADEVSEFLYKIRDDLKSNPTLLQKIFDIIDMYPTCLTSSIWLLGLQNRHSDALHRLIGSSNLKMAVKYAKEWSIYTNLVDLARDENLLSELLPEMIEQSGFDEQTLKIIKQIPDDEFNLSPEKTLDLMKKCELQKETLDNLYKVQSHEAFDTLFDLVQMQSECVISD